MIRILNWLNGWRTDHDGWWVRARRLNDELCVDSMHALMYGAFVEEASVVVSTPEQARALDKKSPK